MDDKSLEFRGPCYYVFGIRGKAPPPKADLKKRRAVNATFKWEISLPLALSLYVIPTPVACPEHY